MPASRRPSKGKSRRKSTAKKPSITQKELKAIARAAREAEKRAKEAEKAYRAAQAEYRKKRKEKEKERKRIRRNTNLLFTGTPYSRTELKKREAQARKRERERTKRYKAQLDQLKRFGVYIPKDSELTDYRKRQINKRFAEFEKYLDPTKYFFVKFGDNRTVKRRAKELDMVHSKTGLFIEKKGGQKKARIKYDPKLKADIVEVVGFTKRGKNRGRKYKEVLPLTTLDRIASEKDRLKKALFSKHPLAKNESIAIGIQDKQAGSEPTWMYRLFQGKSDSSFDALWNFILSYRNTQQKQIEFLRHIVFMKVDTKAFYPTLRTQRGKSKHGRIGK